MSAGVYEFNDEGNVVVYSLDHDYSNNYYYFGSDGRAVTVLLNIWGDLYYFDPSTATAIAQSGWEDISGGEYYFDPSTFKAVDGFQNIYGNIYYFDNHRKVTNQTLTLADQNGVIGGTYTFDDNGIGTLQSSSSQVGWKTINGNWYYLDSNNNFVYGWQKINGSWYYFDPTNVWAVKGWDLINNNWYYFDPTNAWALTGWQHLNNHWYYFDKTNAWPLNGNYEATISSMSFNENVQLNGYVYSSSTTSTEKGMVSPFPLSYNPTTILPASGLTGIGKNLYYFYLNTNQIATGWKAIGNSNNWSWYYFDPQNKYAVSNHTFKNINVKYGFTNGQLTETYFIIVDNVEFSFNPDQL